MENVTLFAVLYDGDVVEMKASLFDAIHFIYEQEFEQEFAMNIAEDTIPTAKEVADFISQFDSEMTTDDNGSIIFQWWKITPVPLCEDVLTAIKGDTSVVNEKDITDEEDAALNAVIAKYEGYDEMSAEADYYAHCDDIWQVGGSI